MSGSFVRLIQMSHRVFFYFYSEASRCSHHMSRLLFLPKVSGVLLVGFIEELYGTSSSQAESESQENIVIQLLCCCVKVVFVSGTYIEGPRPRQR